MPRLLVLHGAEQDSTEMAGKSVPAAPDSAWVVARSHGSCESLGGSTNGKTAVDVSSALSRQHWMRWAMK
ncbi:MAG: hypothetical protein ABJA98_21170 [Acidobacteriota bacterium]